MTEEQFTAQLHGPRPKIVAVVGPTQNTNAFVRAHRDLTVAGCLVLSVGGGILRSDYDQHGHPTTAPDRELTQRLLELQRRRIELADAVFVVNQFGRIGDSTRADIRYAESLGKPVEYLEPIEDVPA